MELRQLRYFLAVASEGTYGRASQKLNIAQPALSRQIQKLEQELGTQLFVRHPHGVTLTEAANDILPRAQHILDEVKAVARVADQTQSNAGGTIRVGVSPGTAEILAYPLASLLRERSSPLRCELVSMLMPTRTQMLRDGKVAFALMNTPKDTAGITMIPLMHEPLCLIARADDERFKGETLQLQQLAGIPLVIGGSSDAGVRATINQAFLEAGLDLITAAEVNTAGASKSLVLEGFGPTVHVAAMARNEIMRGELRAIPIRGLSSTRVLAYAQDATLTTAMRDMMQTLRECLKTLTDNGRWLNGQMIGT